MILVAHFHKISVRELGPCTILLSDISKETSGDRTILLDRKTVQENLALVLANVANLWVSDHVQKCGLAYG